MSQILNLCWTRSTRTVCEFGSITLVLLYVCDQKSVTELLIIKKRFDENHLIEEKYNKKSR